MKAKKYKPNVVYVVEIHGYQYYVGCHCWKKELTECNILTDSGNPLMTAYRKKLITHQEYRECCKLVHVEEYDTKEEALSRETELIQRFKNFYGDRCLNKSEGNMFGGFKGVSQTEEAKKKIKKKLRDFNINNPKPKIGKLVRQYYLDGQFKAEYSSIREAERRTGVYNQNISRCCSGKNKTAGGYLWESA